MDLKRCSQGHMLEFDQDHTCSTKEEVCCFGCQELAEGPIYCCKNCKFYLHKRCGELAPEINHFLHPSHPLVLLPKSPYPNDKSYLCNYCWKICFGFTYHCASCKFDLDINCAFRKQCIHEHLVFVKNQTCPTAEEVHCFGCKELAEGPIYRCNDCKFNLHKRCAELPLQIDHAIHPRHPLFLVPIPPFTEGKACLCKCCYKDCFGFVYFCASCDFFLDINCAFQASIKNHSFHEHPLVLFEKPPDRVIIGCIGCKKLLSGPVYRCMYCDKFDLHKECAELPCQLNHPYHRIHVLTLLANAPTHSEECLCNLCKTKWNGFIYYCFICNFSLTLEDVLSLHSIMTATHEHPWTLLSRPISFICDACGTDGDCTPYICTKCNLIVHKNCISLPFKIRITRHHHPIEHTYFLQQDKYEKPDCRICHKEVNSEFGSYYCSVSTCNYIAHVNCATEKSIWDETEELEASDSENLITDIFSEMTMGEDKIATDIRHAYHEHNLILTFSNEVIYDDNCDGCMRPILAPFYSCEECRFFLHKSCAELPRRKQQPSHRHLVTLAKDSLSYCYACFRFHSGFSYICGREHCDFEIDIKCSLQADTLSHPSHEHLLYLDHKYQGSCSACPNYIWDESSAYRCTKGCKFILDFACITLPATAWYKHDKHPLSLAYHDASDPNQFYCDICEEERYPNHWFYYCAECDNSVHPKCILGELRFVKVGNRNICLSHSHPLTFVKNIWNCPRCSVCSNLCNGQSLECKECNVIVHWKCHRLLKTGKNNTLDYLIE